VEIKKIANAGTVESSDILIFVEPGTNGIEIKLDSVVANQFGRRIRQVIEATAQKAGVENVKITATDKGALDCTIQARTLIALHRAAEQEISNWEDLLTWNV
jgi:citrate lyase subunit gamma (acyl carrier protein)